MPDELFEGLDEEVAAKIKAEIDRRATQASETASKNTAEKLTKELTEQFEQKYQEELIATTSKLKEQITMTEEEKVKEALNELQAEQERFKRDQLKFQARQTLKDNGFSDDDISNLEPIFGAFDTKEALDAALGNLVTVNTTRVENAVNSYKEELAAAATLPGAAGGKQTPQDTNSKIAEIRTKVDDPRMAAALEAQALIDASLEEN